MKIVLFLLLCYISFMACRFSSQENAFQTQVAQTMTALVNWEDSLAGTATVLASTHEAVDTLIISTDFSTKLPSVPATSMPVVTPQPGLFIKGFVTLEDGSGLEGVGIYLGFASYPGRLIATTDSSGYYQSEMIPIPGDEMVRVWAELESYTIEPKDNTWSWEQGVYSWRHYHGYEKLNLDFLAEE